MPMGQDPLGLIRSTLQTNQQAQQNAPSNRPFTDALRFRMEQEKQAANLQQLEAQQAAMTKNQQRQDLKMAFEMVQAGVPSAAVFDAVNVPNSHHKLFKFMEKQAKDAQRAGAIGQRAAEATELQAGPPSPEVQRLIAEKLQAIRGLEAGHPIPNDPGGAARAQIEQAGVLREQGIAADQLKADREVSTANRKAFYASTLDKTEWERLDTQRRLHGGLPPGRMKKWQNGLLAQAGSVSFTNPDGQTETWSMELDKIPDIRAARILDSTRTMMDAQGLIDDLSRSVDNPYLAGTSGGAVAMVANVLGIAGDFGRVLTPEEDEEVAGQIIGTVQAMIHADAGHDLHTGSSEEFLDEINSTKGANEAAMFGLDYYLAKARRGDTGGRFSIQAVKNQREITDIYSGDRVRIKARLTKTRSMLQDSIDRAKSMLPTRIPSFEVNVAPPGQGGQQQPGAVAPGAPPEIPTTDDTVQRLRDAGILVVPLGEGNPNAQ